MCDTVVIHYLKHFSHCLYNSQPVFSCTVYTSQTLYITYNIITTCSQNSCRDFTRPLKLLCGVWYTVQLVDPGTPTNFHDVSYWASILCVVMVLFQARCAFWLHLIVTTSTASVFVGHCEQPATGHCRQLCIFWIFLWFMIYLKMLVLYIFWQLWDKDFLQHLNNKHLQKNCYTGWEFDTWNKNQGRSLLSDQNYALHLPTYRLFFSPPIFDIT